MSLLIDAALVIISISILLALIRLIIGPTGADRIVAADVVIANVVATIALTALKLRNDLFLDAVLVVTLLSFVGTVAFARFLLRSAAGGGNSDGGPSADYGSDASAAQNGDGVRHV